MAAFIARRLCSACLKHSYYSMSLRNVDIFRSKSLASVPKCLLRQLSTESPQVKGDKPVGDTINKVADKDKASNNDSKDKKDEIKARAERINFWGMKVLAVVMGGGLIMFYLSLKNQKELELEQERNKTLKEIGMGGSWTLVDHNGNMKTSEDLQGQWLLIYFGFTHCPDICPDVLERMVKITEKIDSNTRLPKITPVFITVDPARDTVAAVRKYIREFSPKMIGLTGSEEEIKKVAKNYRVYYSNGPKSEDDDYIIDHTVVMYLVNPDGGFLDYYGRERTEDHIISSISKHMKKYKQLNK
ncbi:hypothetical protein CHS0354_031122 [Potamilus streckersoni]|uniref:Uncharacterized protein n=1 Tax=Potamilus streckersoni TaxID=2493646 RepID=A0AAE0WAJ8_9BIVA|nr:hypothetical protein CHS0354_031122 [Potamilus streckersoni]